MIWFFVILGVVFLTYALVMNMSKTPAEDSIPKRVWASLVLAAGTLGAAIASWFHSTPTTP